MDQDKIPKSWAWRRIGDVCLELIGGGTPSKKIIEYFKGDIVWLTPTEVPKNKIAVLNNSKVKITFKGLQHSSARIIPQGSVLLTSRASIGFVAIAGCDLTTNQGFASFVCLESVYNYYFGYWLWANRDLLEANATGTTFKEIAKSKLRELEIVLPPLPEQHRIVEKIEELFTRLDAGVEALKKIKAQLKRYRQAVLKYAFEGKLTEEWRMKNPPTQAPLGYPAPLSKEGVREFDDLPELPEGWQLIKIKELLKTIDGDRGKNYPKKDEYFKDDYCLFLSTKNVRTGKFVFDDNQFITKRKDKILGSGKLQINDIVITTRGTLGNVALYDSLIPYKNVRINSGMLILRVSNDLLNKNFLIKFILSPFFTSQLKEKQTGTAQPQIPANILREIIIPLPPFPEQHQIVSEIERRFSMADAAEKVVEQSLKQAERLRQSILKRAFEGKLVPQDPNDEPAEKLLERIKAERTKIETSTKISGKVKKRGKN